MSKIEYTDYLIKRIGAKGIEHNLAYSNGSSTASEVNAQSDPGVVFKFFSASQQSMRSM